MKNRWMVVAAMAVLLPGSARPSAAETAPSLVQGDPGSLVVQPEDFPVAFATIEEDAQEGGHAAIFSRGAELLASGLQAGDLVGVMARVELLDSVAEASLSFADQQDAAAVGSSLPPAGSQRMLNSVRLTAEDVGADEGVLFRVESEVAGVRVIEHRYRLRVANAVANLVIGAKAGAGGTEPPTFASQSKDIARQQVNRLVAGRR